MVKPNAEKLVTDGVAEPLQAAAPGNVLPAPITVAALLRQLPKPSTMTEINSQVRHHVTCLLLLLVLEEEQQMCLLAGMWLTANRLSQMTHPVPAIEPIQWQPHVRTACASV